MRHKITIGILLSSVFFFFQCASGDEYNKKDEKGKTPLHYAVMAGETDKATEMVENGGDPNIQDRGWSSLHYAVSKGDLKLVKLFLEKKADANLASEKGWTPMMVAAFFTEKEAFAIMDALKAAGANINAQSKAGKTPLYLAVKKGQVEKVKWLIANGADKNIAAQNGVKPLDLAKSSKNADLIILLSDK